MNAIREPASGPGLTSATVDASNPWLGLASFTEETRAYFFGREAEVAELARRVQAKLLTVLFGKSGLGKTSIVRAGLVPRLQGQGYLPVYVRLDYGRDSPEPAEQIKEAIRRTSRTAQWTQAGVALEGESLWEFLHHRDDVLLDESGTRLTPLLIFDQFEEIFTLAQADESGRSRASRFLEQLADLVENRPPKALETKLDQDDSAAERFDFSRSDYRVLVVLREDYLAPLESLKRLMPSIAQNRLRLAPMTGTQALAAVLQPGRKLVSEEVAAAIVRFVAGGAELANAEVEPSLLSLICRELNDARITQGRSEISLDLLAGSHATILSNFFERALADQPASVRHIIEDDLLTDSGYRESIAEESLLRRFAEAGAAADALAVLVNRRLLRIEERLDVRRVELTHDVLCGIVKASRDWRREQQARAATEKLIAEQRERELAARRALVRARKVAAACTVLSLAAVIAGGVALVNGARARRAEQLAEQARTNSEHLLGYLTDDFMRELESFGRLNLMEEFARRQADYFHGLPAEMRGLETTRNAALALSYRAKALRYLGDLKGAQQSADEAVSLLARQRAAGDQSDLTTVALARAYTVQCMILDQMNDDRSRETSQLAAQLIGPLVQPPHPLPAAQRVYVEILQRIAFEYQGGSEVAEREKSVQAGKEAQRIAVELGARGDNLEMAAMYAEAGAWMASALGQLDRAAESRKAEQDVIAVADRVLALRPGYRLALHAKQIALSQLGNVAGNDLNAAEHLRYAQLGVETSRVLLDLDPRNTTSLNNLGVSLDDVGNSLWDLGRMRESIPYHLQAVDMFGRAAIGATAFFLTHGYSSAFTAYLQAMLGDSEGAERTIRDAAPFNIRLREIEPEGSFTRVVLEWLGRLPVAEIAYEHDDFTGARQIAREAMKALQASKPSRGFQSTQRAVTLAFTADIAARAEYALGDFAASEDAGRIDINARKVFSDQGGNDQRFLAATHVWLAMAVAAQGRTQEAAAIISPWVKFYDELARRNHDVQWIPFEQAQVLYAQALADGAHRAQLLARAAGLMSTLRPNIMQLHYAQRWQQRIQDARAGHLPGLLGASRERSKA